MDRKISEIFKEAILKPNPSAEIVNTRTKIISVAVNMHKFSEIASSSEPLSEKFAIKFLTPTAFRRSIYDCCPSCPRYAEYLMKSKKGEKTGKPCKYAVSCQGLNIPLPIPSLMFKNMARIWSAFSDTQLDVWEATRWAENAVMVAGFPKPGIKTVRVYEHPTTNKWISGFLGTVRFAIKKMYNERYAKTISALLKMAEVTNVGVRRTAGLGLIKYLTPAEEEKQKEK
jgi:CRISPR/Cas system endoribonuclease Cas6 (RAMP superfamily)